MQSVWLKDRQYYMPAVTVRLKAYLTSPGNSFEAYSRFTASMMELS